VSIDASSTGVLADVGVAAATRRFAELRPDVFFANADEAAMLDLVDWPGVVVVKRGADPVEVIVNGRPRRVPVPALEFGVDTTGAGDAFAGGFLAAWTKGGDVEGGASVRDSLVRTRTVAARRDSASVADSGPNGRPQGPVVASVAIFQSRSARSGERRRADPLSGNDTAGGSGPGDHAVLDGQASRARRRHERILGAHATGATSAWSRNDGRSVHDRVGNPRLPTVSRCSPPASAGRDVEVTGDVSAISMRSPYRSAVAPERRRSSTSPNARSGGRRAVLGSSRLVPPFAVIGTARVPASRKPPRSCRAGQRPRRRSALTVDTEASDDGPTRRALRSAWRPGGRRVLVRPDPVLSHRRTTGGQRSRRPGKAERRVGNAVACRAQPTRRVRRRERGGLVSLGRAVARQRWAAEAQRAVCGKRTRFAAGGLLDP
jgi:hypothetical protein